MLANKRWRCYRNERLEAGASPTTVNKELSILRSIFNDGFEDYTPPKVSRVQNSPVNWRSLHHVKASSPTPSTTRFRRMQSIRG